MKSIALPIELSKQNVELSLIGTPRSICSLVVPARILFADISNQYIESVYAANQFTESTYGSLHEWI